MQVVKKIYTNQGVGPFFRKDLYKFVWRNKPYGKSPKISKNSRIQWYNYGKNGMRYLSVCNNNNPPKEYGLLGSIPKHFRAELQKKRLLSMWFLSCFFNYFQMNLWNKKKHKFNFGQLIGFVPVLDHCQLHGFYFKGFNSREITTICISEKQTVEIYDGEKFPPRFIKIATF